MNKYCVLILLLLLLTACGGNKPAEPAPEETAPDTTLTDTVQADTASLVEEAPPAAADGVFDDFAFNFMRNRRFQRDRVRFPLTFQAGGTTQLIQREQWQHDALFRNADFFAALFASQRSMRRAHDRQLAEVSIERLDFQDASVRAYRFEKENGAWRLTALAHKALAETENADFFSFFSRFAADASYRISHVANPFSLTLVDPDTLEPVEGDANAEQWDDYAPELPTDALFCVNYGQVYSDPSSRILVISSVDGAMTSTISFRKQAGEWSAVQLVNN